MGTFKFGRAILTDPQSWRITTDADDEINTISGILRSATLAETLLLRDQLRGHKGHLVAATYTTEPTVNGFYILDNVDVEANWQDGAYQGKGYLRFTLQVTWKGSYSSTELQSLLSRVSAVEDFSTTPSYWWAPAIGAKAVDLDPAGSVDIDRDGASGIISVSTEIDADANPSWSVDPANYLDGAVYVYAADTLRTGLDMPMDPTDWYMGNDNMEIRPDAYQGTTSGELEVRFHNGTAWGSWTQFFVNWAGTNKVPSWDFVSIIRNSPEAATIRLVRDAEEAPFSQRKLHELDLTLRRGGRFVTGIYKFTGAAATHALEMDGTDTVTRPGGTASYVLPDTLVSGHQLVYGTPRDFTLATREIQLDVAATSMPFWIGAAVDDAANSTGNGPADLAEQYVGQVAETVRAVRR